MDIESQAIDNASPRMASALREYIESNGGSVNHPHADSLIVLYTTGRKSRLIRGAPLVSMPDGTNLLVLGSRGGAPRHPDWYWNLVDDPNVWVRNKHDVYEATAVTLTPEERAGIWPKITERFPFYGDYQEGIDREIPVIRLSPKT